jgi:uncharacterized OB-fold protein
MNAWDSWWEATEREVLLVQACEECGHRQHYPRALCLACGSDHLTWIEASGEATIHSFTISHRSPDPERFTPPYVVALIDLAEGPRLLSRVISDDPENLRCDQPVTLSWLPHENGRHLPVFEPVDKEKAE